jgi:electron transport complex protein RnfG
MFKEIIKPALILFMICAVVTGALAYVNGVTEPIIAENNRVAEKESLSEVLPGAESFSDPKTAEQLKAEGFNVSERIGKLYEAQKGGKLAGYVIEVSTKGYGGTIKMFIGIDTAQSITGVKLSSHNETPGLGAKGAEPKFKDQFLGTIPEKAFGVVKSNAKADNEIQAISGATVTSRAVTNGVADAVALVRSMGGK